MSRQKRGKYNKLVGELRQSQMLTTFGPGAMVDLPEYSVLIGGLEYWQCSNQKRIFEDRLESKIRELEKLEMLALYEPPASNEEPSTNTGVTTFLFPTWFLAQVDETFKAPDGQEFRTRPLIPRSQLVKGRYLDRKKKKIPVIPVRFVQACAAGHISDINWSAYVGGTGQLWIDEGGAGNDFAEIYVRDERSNRRRSLSYAGLQGANALGKCQGKMPWLGPMHCEDCSEVNRLLTRSASNAYFSRTLSAIAIPEPDVALKEAVERVYDDFLQHAVDMEDVVHDRKKKPRVMDAIAGFSDEEVWAHIQRRKAGTDEKRTIKQVEYDTLIATLDDPVEDIPGGDFYARARQLSELTDKYRDRFQRVVLVHRLREVVALLGFTRFEPAITDNDGELSINVTSAPLARETTWLPAIENRGEGIFLAFSESAIKDWQKRPEVAKRSMQLEKGFDSWAERKQAKEASFPGLPYLMLHSLAHLLITTVSLECGYSASAIRERIYAGKYGYGILLYTGATGSEGTLGGLVEVGRNIESYLQQALELGRLCSNDPICAQHDPTDLHEERFLHGSACHGCLLIAETSCERRNEFLDRALVIPTVSTATAAFFNN